MRRFAIIGLGRFGSVLAVELAGADREVIAIDSERGPVEAITDLVTHAVILDATDEKALLSQDVHTVDCAVVAIGENFEANILATLNCKNFGIARVITRAKNQNELKILQRIGADLVIQPEESSARRLAHEMVIPTMRGYMELVEGVAICQVEAPVLFNKRTLEDIHLRRNFGVNLVAIRRRLSKDDPRESVIYPGADTEIQPGDVLVLVGSDQKLKDLAVEAR